MDPKAALQTVQHELQQQLQDLLGIDGEAQCRNETSHDGRKDQGSNSCFSSKGRKDEDMGFRLFVTSQRYDTCIQYWAGKEENVKRKGSNNNYNEVTLSQTTTHQAMHIEESAEGKECTMEVPSVYISQREETMPLKKSVQQR